ncbi:hypothetical protein LCGC14_0141330 [marine sediment metagenome]|uniref:Uncharacterized protein n=1 Tax=marine sediment metagenome TaxID=412755 RepID=A0A0F9VGE0_9ZZZZ
MLRVTIGEDEFQVWFSHPVQKPFEIEGLTGRIVDDDRRCTIVQIRQNGAFGSQGVAVCNPNDNFRKATGRKIALADAMWDFNKDERIAIWNEYHKHCSL